MQTNYDTSTGMLEMKKRTHQGLHLYPKGVNQAVNQEIKVYSSMEVNTGKALDNYETWLTTKEAVNLLNITKTAIHKNRKEGKYIAREILSNGGIQYEFLLSSLPIDAQVTYWQKIRGVEIFPRNGKEKYDLTATDRQIALSKADFLNLYLEAANGANHGMALKRRKEFLDRYNTGAISHLYEIIGEVSFKTAERWKKIYFSANRDPFSLAPQYRQAINRPRAISEIQAKVILGKALSPNSLRINEIIREARKEMHAQGVACDISDMTIRRWIEDWKSRNYHLWKIFREGEKAVNDQVLPYIQRDRDQIEVGDIAVADGHTLNFEILNPETGKPKRMALLILYDFKSSFPLGWEIMPTENVQAIASCFRHGIINLGFIPRLFYLDNGKAFRARFFTGMKDFRTAGLAGLFERLGCQVIHAWPYHGQSKPVERFFGTFGELERLMPTYTGSSIADQPARLHRNEKFHRKMYESLTQGIVPTLLDAHTTIAGWFSEYVQRPQQDGYLKGLRPIDVFTEGMQRIKLSAEYSNRQINPSELDYLMMSAEIRTLYRNGIRFLNRYFFNEALFALEKGRKHSFMIRYDLNNPDSILVYEGNGRFLCQAFDPGKVHPAAGYLGNEQDVEKLEETIRVKRGLEKETKEVAKAMWQHLSGAALPPAKKRQEISESLKAEINILPEVPQAPEPERVDILAALAKASTQPGENHKIPFTLPLPVQTKKPGNSPKLYLYETDKVYDELQKAENE